VDIHVEKTDTLAGHGQGHGNVRRNSAFSHAPLAGENHDFMFDSTEGFLQFFVLVPATFTASAGAG
jgi:hypothetical protein